MKHLDILRIDKACVIKEKITLTYFSRECVCERCFYGSSSSNLGNEYSLHHRINIQIFSWSTMLS